VSAVLTRHAASPILRRRDVPDHPPEVVDATSVFNPGATVDGDEVVLLLRVQTRGRETFLLTARSVDGVSFEVAPEPVGIRGLESAGERIYHVYDPRITRMEGAWYATFAADADGGCRTGIARSDDLDRFDLVSYGGGDVRNAVLLPGRIGGRYVRLERPNRLDFGGQTAAAEPAPVAGVPLAGTRAAGARLAGTPSTGAPSAGEPTTGDTIVASVSGDLVEWNEIGPVMRGRPHYWDERIGSGPPPLPTGVGWLHVYHGVATHFRGVNIYQAGVVLLDRDDPTRVLGRSRDNIQEPREMYEMVGQVPNVVFPSGWVVRDPQRGLRAAGDGGQEPIRDDAEVLLYYGAADTCVGLATASVGALLGACLRRKDAG